MSARDYLHLRDVNVTIGGLKTLSIDEWTLPVASGVTGVILGPNGAGKTTLLNVITSYADVPKPGEIYLRGSQEVRLTRRAPAAIVHAGISRTFQSPCIFTSLAVRQVLDVAAAFTHGGRNGHARHRGAIVEEILCHLDLEPNLQTSALTLPMARRLELARALITGPRVLLLDEPTAGLAREDRKSLVEFIGRTLPTIAARLNETGWSRFSTVGVALVTHDMAFLDSLRDNALLNDTTVHFMNLGRIVLSADLDTVRQSALVREAYLGA